MGCILCMLFEEDLMGERMNRGILGGLLLIMVRGEVGIDEWNGSNILEGMMRVWWII